MNTSLANHDFINSVHVMRRVLPKLSFGLLVTTYLVSAIIMGLFHAQSSTGIGFTIAAFAVPLAIQAGRGAIVFFFQLNPAQIQRKLSFGIIAATVLLLLSLCEAMLVMWDYGLSWTVSVSTLMVIGYIIEIMILKKTQFATQMELYNNQDQLQQLKQFYLAKRDFEQFMSALHSGTSRVERVEPEENEKLIVHDNKKTQRVESQPEIPLNGHGLGKE